MSDRSLIGSYQNGDQNAATELYIRYAQRLRALIRERSSPGLASRVDAEDLVQSVFRRFFRRVRQGAYTVARGTELWSLFLVLAVNRLRKEERFQRAAKRDLRLTSNNLEPKTKAADDSAALTALQLTIDEFLTRLPVDYGAVVHLRLEGHDVDTIASRVGRAKRSVERMLHTVREKLGGLLQPGQSR